MPRILVAIDVNTADTGTAIALVSQMMRKVEWPEEIDSVEVGEVEEETVDG